MKKIAFALILVLTVIFSGCEDYNVDEPSILYFSSDREVIDVGNSVRFEFAVDADNAVIWPGDKGRSYEAYLADIDINSDAFVHDTVNRTRNNNSGIVINLTVEGSEKVGKSAAIKYTEAGVYTAVLIATRTNGDKENSVLKAKSEIQITVQ